MNRYDERTSKISNEEIIKDVTYESERMFEHQQDSEVKVTDLEMVDCIQWGEIAVVNTKLVISDDI